MNKSIKFRAINTALMNVPMAFIVSLVAQILSIHTVVPKLLAINFVMAFIVSFIVGMTFPLVKWGIKFAEMCKAKSGTLLFGICINAVVNLVYVFANSLVLSYYNVCIRNKAPIIACVIGIASTFIPIYICGFIVAFTWTNPAEKITTLVCKK